MKNRNKHTNAQLKIRLCCFMPLFFALMGCDNGPDAVEKSNMTLVTSYVEAVQKNDFDTMANCLSENFQGYGPSIDDSIKKKLAMERWNERSSTLYEKIKYNESTLIAMNIPNGRNKGDWVAHWAELEVRFKDNDDKVVIWANFMYKVEDNQIVKSYSFYNEADALEQLGYVFLHPDELK